MQDDELSLLSTEELTSPLDEMESAASEAEVPPPDPEQMLELLQSSQASQRTIAARLFAN